jgi:alkylation response protein AidB-like acyl-CoA dehydrogenase
MVMNVDHPDGRSVTALLRNLNNLESVLSAEADSGERARTLTGRTVAVLKDSGILSMWVPKSLGGLELDFPSGLRVIEELARIDASAAWVVFVVCGSAFAAARMSDEAAETVHARPHDLLCGSLNPPGMAVQVEGGYRLTGRWPFTSGRDHAAWLLLSAIVRNNDDGAAPPPPATTTAICCLVPADASVIHDTWHTGGLRATGSNDIEVTDVFVPASMTFRFGSASDRRSRYHQGPLYRLPLSGGIGTPIAAVALGIARRAIDAVVGISTAKTPVGRTSALRNQPVLQADVAKAEAAVRSARSWLYATADSIAALADSNVDLPDALRRDLLLASVHATRSAAYAVDLMHLSGGGSAVYATCPLERALRDIHTVTQHRRSAPIQFEIAGRMMLGLEPGDPSVLQ